MTVFSCAPGLEEMLTCIYEAKASGKPYREIRLVTEPVMQMSLLDEYIHIEKDSEKAAKVMEAICVRISPKVYDYLAYLTMAYEEDTLDVIYHVMLLAFSYGENAIHMMQYRDVLRAAQIHKRLSSEVMRFREILRFNEIDGQVYIAHIEPKSRIVQALGPAFSDRMPSEHFMIIDDAHREAVIHPRNEDYYLKTLSESEFEKLRITETAVDEYTDLWKVFFNTIGIEQRKNYKCQRNLFPLWARKHAVEFHRNQK